MKTTVFIFRHGEIDNPRDVMYGGNIDFPLNKKGEGQIKETVEDIKSKGYLISRVYSSPLKRAISSSKIIQGVFGIREPLIEDNLKDTWIPALAGKPHITRDKIHAENTDEYSEKFAGLGNERRENIVKRMRNVFDKVVEENQGQIVAIVSHGDPIRFLIQNLEHPNQETPSMHILVKTKYPKKGRAIKVLVENDKIKEIEYI